MSSDTFHLRVLALQGDTVDLLCTTSTAGGYNDYAVTRSFALMAIEDLMPSPAGKRTPLQSALHAIAGDTPPVWEASFHQAHVGTFIAGTELLERRGIIVDQAAWSEGRFAEGPGFEEKFPLHSFVLRVRVTDPQWLVGLKVGASAGTTAFDAWWDDPKRPSEAALRKVEREATRWPPGAAAKRSAAKKSAVRVKKTATKTAATKKAATKKTTKKAPAKKSSVRVKKTATKKAATKKAPTKTTKKAPAKKAATKKPAAKKTTKKTTKKTAARRAT